MESEQRRKRKRMGRPFSNAHHYFSLRSLFLCLFFFLFLFFFSSDRFSLTPSSFSFRPSLSASSFSLIYSSASHSILDSFNPTFLNLSFPIEHRILFPDHLLLMVTGGEFYRTQKLDCVYYKLLNGSDDGNSPILDALSQPVISTDRYDEFRSIVRCPIPPANYSCTAVDLRRPGEVVDRKPSWESLTNPTTYSWNNLAYEAYLDGDTVVVFVKGLNLRPHKVSDPTRFRCHFGFENPDTNSSEFTVTTNAISAAQEVVRCSLPRGIANTPNKALGIRVTVSRSVENRRTRTGKLVPSVARIRSQNRQSQKRHELCACTMVWNQASAVKEWIMYHSWLGVQQWFIYDNNSDDEIESVVEDLNLQGYNVKREPWPWVKSQEAGFSHCALRSKEECSWVGFFDVDEFFNLKDKSQNSLKSLVSNFTNSRKYAEIRTACRSFGPSGLTSPPDRGVSVGYTCRLKSPERHKSIVKPEMVHSSLLNVVHHFLLKEGVRSVQLKEEVGVINHYKYQVWERFKAKFLRRVATYVVDWQEDRNKRSKDRAPGLGTEAVEPPNWRRRFCEVWDTDLKDFILANFADPETGTLSWEGSNQLQRS